MPTIPINENKITNNFINNSTIEPDYKQKLFPPKPLNTFNVLKFTDSEKTSKDEKLNKITLNIIQKGKRELIIVILIRLISNFKGESDVSLLAINCLVQLIKITNFKKYNIVEILTEIIIVVDDDDLFNGKNNKKINELFLKYIKNAYNPN